MEHIYLALASCSAVLRSLVSSAKAEPLVVNYVVSSWPGVHSTPAPRLHLQSPIKYHAIDSRKARASTMSCNLNCMSICNRPSKAKRPKIDRHSPHGLNKPALTLSRPARRPQHRSTVSRPLSPRANYRQQPVQHEPSAPGSLRRRWRGPAGGRYSGRFSRD